MVCGKDLTSGDARAGDPSKFGDSMRIDQCRLCCSHQIEKVVDLGHHPLADTFLYEEQLDHAETAFPLQLGQCADCGHVFTLFAIPPFERYQKQDYSYDSSNSAVSIAHFKEFAQAVLAIKPFAPTARIVDIGSNVGTLLSHFKDQGFGGVIGVEPSRNIAEIAVKSGIKTINDFFNTAAAEKLLLDGPIDILLSSNVLNHADDMAGLLDTAKAVLDKDGVFVFEVPYLLELIKRTAFDTIYHEHVHYYGLKPLAAILQAHGFSIFNVDYLDYMCGSIRVYTRQGGNHADAIGEQIAREEAFGLYDRATYHRFMAKIDTIKTAINSALYALKAKGEVIIGIGAATKGNTLLNFCKLDGGTLDYITDASPLKIGKYTPGSHIKIIADQDITKDATYALILPWNIAPMLQKKLAHLGLKFYVPQIEEA